MSEAMGLIIRGGDVEGVMALPKGFSTSRRGLLASNPTWESFEAMGRLIGAYSNHATEDLPWMVGDFLNIGADLFPDRYEQALYFSGWTYETLKNYASAARRVPPDNRFLGERGLPIRFGMDVAHLSHQEQRAVLKKADKEGLNASETRRLAHGDSNYKRKAVPEKGATKKERINAAFERLYAGNEGYLSTVTRMEACHYMWLECSILWSEPGV